MDCDIAHHYCVPGLAKTGTRVLLENHKYARLWPGFVRRLTLVSLSNPLKATTVALWNSVADYEAWGSSHAHIRGGDYGLWDRVTESEKFQVIPELASSSPVAGGKVAGISYRCAVAGRLEDGKRLILQNGRGQRRFPGFVAHLTLVSLEDPLKLASVTVWKNQQEYEAWRASPACLQGTDSGLWSQPPGRELFEVVPELPWVFSKVPGEGVRLLD